jgi:peptidyl-tRNA hydrolase, PTH1 family
MRFLFSSFAKARGHKEQSDDRSSSGRFLIVGLGNPGPEHAGNRHNVGFWCLNRLARRESLAFRRNGRLASTAEGQIAGKSVLLVKPMTFVNRSGDAVGALLRRNKIRPEDMIVVYDELDLPVGALRIRERGSHGGQNGMKSIIAAAGTQDFPRVRIGIGRPVVDGQPTRDPEHVADYVLNNPPPAERAKLEDAVQRAVEAIELALSAGVETAMARFNSGRE